MKRELPDFPHIPADGLDFLSVAENETLDSHGSCEDNKYQDYKTNDIVAPDERGSQVSEPVKKGKNKSKSKAKGEEFKITVQMPIGLVVSAKMYIALHHGVTMRQLIIEALDVYLKKIQKKQIVVKEQR